MNATQRRIAVLADDLIWASRLVAAVEKSGARAAAARSADDLRAILTARPEEPVAAVVIDLNGRRYDGVEQVRTAAAGGRRVLAVGQHEDLELRRRALAAGAERVYSYNKLFRDGSQVIGRLLDAQAVQAAAEDGP